MKCPNCDGPEHPKWKAHTFKAKPASVPLVPRPPKREPNPTLDFVEPESTGRARKPAPKAKGFDKVAYQREYMRKRRAKAAKR